MSRVLTILVAVALAFPAASPAATGPPTFPRDHFGHPQSSIEWWYFTALAKDASGTPYSVFVTLFASKGGLVQVSHVVKLATDAVALCPPVLEDLRDRYLATATNTHTD